MCSHYSISTGNAMYQQTIFLRKVCSRTWVARKQQRRYMDRFVCRIILHTPSSLMLFQFFLSVLFIILVILLGLLLYIEKLFSKFCLVSIFCWVVFLLRGDLGNRYETVTSLWIMFFGLFLVSFCQKHKLFIEVYIFRGYIVKLLYRLLCSSFMISSYSKMNAQVYTM